MNNDLPEHTAALQAARAGDFAEARRQLSLLPDGPAPRLVRAEPDLFTSWRNPDDLETEREYDLAWGIDPNFFVVTPEPERAAAAVFRAGHRFPTVSHLGRETPEWEIWHVGTCKNVDIRQLADGLVIYADARGELPPLMGAELLRILVDELAADNVRALIMHQVRHDFRGPVPQVREEPSGPQTHASRGKAWFVTRHRGIEIGDGRRYVDRQCLRSDGSWTFDQAAARTWPETPSDAFVLGLRQTSGNESAQAEFLDVVLGSA
jgi:hypothetical protein